MLGIVSRRFVAQELRAVRFFAKKMTSGAGTGSGTSQAKSIENVTGLSEKCVAVPNGPVGPGASKNSEYKNPEYFCYHVNSFAEAEIEMAKFRLPAPSNKEKFQPQ